MLKIIHPRLKELICYKIEILSEKLVYWPFQTTLSIMIRAKRAKDKGEKPFSDRDVTPRTWKFWKSVLQWMDNRDAFKYFQVSQSWL